MSAIPGAVAGSIYNAVTSLAAPYGTVCECWCAAGGWLPALVFAQDSRLAPAALLGPAARALRARVCYTFTDEGLSQLACEGGARLVGGKRARPAVDAAEGGAAGPASPARAPEAAPAAEAIYRVRVLGGVGAEAEAEEGGAAAASAAAPPPLAPTDVLSAWGCASDTFTLVPASHLRPLQPPTRARLQQRLGSSGGSGGGAGGGGPRPPPGVPKKYWDRRLALWRRWEEGVSMDAEGWYSTTPEAAALHMAGAAPRSACSASAPRIVLELFAGSGGNSVAWLRTLGAGSVLVAVEVHLPRLLQAVGNARVYADDMRGAGVAWVHGDALELLAGLGAAARGQGRAWCRQGQVERLLALAAQGQGGAPVGVAGVLEALVGCSPGAPGAGAPSAQCVVDVLFLAPPWGGGKYKAACSSGKGRFSLARDLAVTSGGGASGGGSGSGAHLRLSGIQLIQAACGAGLAGVVQAFLPKHTGAADIAAAFGLREGGALPRAEWVELRSPWLRSAQQQPQAPALAGACAGAALAPGDISVQSVGVDGRAIGLLVTSVREPASV